ncbi:MAG: carboxypeptidase [Rhodospirillales bacterium]|nr:carboxypeptidase [Rhodospirillales bacterium]
MSYQDLLQRLGAINDVLTSSSVLVWDSRTMMPPRGVAVRGQQIATLSTVAAEMLMADETSRLLDAADRATAHLPDDAAERRGIAQTRAGIALHRRIPSALRHRQAELRATAQAAWIEARAKSDFAGFQPYLEESVALARQLADAIGWSAAPYDALIGLPEPGETTASLRALFTRIREGIAPLLRAVSAAKAPRTDFLQADYPVALQHDFALHLARTIGYDLDRGRLDPTVHPFEISFTRDDVRITTRYPRNFLPASLFGTLHETGHALYEQGVDPAYSRGPLATDFGNLYAVGGVSFGAHESQSRLWENHVGRSRDFWALHYGALRDRFPEQLAGVDDETFHRAVNSVRPGLIRVEADELTYDFHIMLRVEIESQLLDGTLKVKDLPTAWNEAIKRDLGLDVPDDRRGVLQDIHWSTGYIGTFCTYTIGNVMAAQLMASARQQLVGLDRSLTDGDYAPLLGWLRDNVHQHGRRFSRNELLVRASGRSLDPEPYIDYLTAKYTALYGVVPT